MKNINNKEIVHTDEEIAEVVGNSTLNYTHHQMENSEEQTITNITIRNVGTEAIPDMPKSKIRSALKQLKNKKVPGDDGITTEMLRAGGETIKILFNQCLHKEKIPTKWKTAEVRRYINH